MSIRGTIAAVSAVLLALGLGACGTAAGTSGNGANTADSSAGTSAKPMTRKEAAEYYGKLVKPFNDAMDEFNLEYYSHDGVAASDAAAKVAKEAKAAAVKMGRTVWPKDAEKYAKATAKDFSADAVDFGKYAECATIDEMDAIQAAASSESPSVGLRKVLGMEAAPDFDYFTIVDSHSDGADVSGYAQGTFTIRNGLKSTVYHLSATIAILDKDGNSVGETYPQAQSPTPAGGTWAASYIVSPDQLEKGVKVKVTGVSWEPSDSADKLYELAVDGAPLDLR